jgi:Uma2 family endonuclease
MSVAALPNPVTKSPPAPVAVPQASWLLRRFSVAEYQKMIQANVLTEDDALELLEGWVVYKMPRNPIHDGTISKCDVRLRTILPSGWLVRLQSAITTTDSEPEPDLVLARGGPDDYMVRHPGAGDVGLVVEVADSSLSRDRDAKGPIYARAGIPTYWIINLVDRLVEVYTDPSGPVSLPSYRQRRDLRPGEQVSLSLPGSQSGTVAVSDLLP